MLVHPWGVATIVQSTVTFLISLDVDRPAFEWRRDFSEVNYNDVQDYLANVDWIGSLYHLQNVNDKYETFLSILYHS